MTKKPSLRISNLSEAIQLVRVFSPGVDGWCALCGLPGLRLCLPALRTTFQEARHEKVWRIFPQRCTRIFFLSKEKSSCWNDGTVFLITFRGIMWESLWLGPNAWDYCERQNQLQTWFANSSVFFFVGLSSMEVPTAIIVLIFINSSHTLVETIASFMSSYFFFKWIVYDVCVLEFFNNSINEYILLEEFDSIIWGEVS